MLYDKFLTYVISVELLANLCERAGIEESGPKKEDVPSRCVLPIPSVPIEHDDRERAKLVELTTSSSERL